MSGWHEGSRWLKRPADDDASDLPSWQWRCPGTDRRWTGLVGLRVGAAAAGGRPGAAVGKPGWTVARRRPVQAGPGDQPGEPAGAAAAWWAARLPATVQPVRLALGGLWLGLDGRRLHQRLRHLRVRQRHRGAGVGRPDRLGERLRVRVLAGPDGPHLVAVPRRAAAVSTLALAGLGDRRPGGGDHDRQCPPSRRRRRPDPEPTGGRGLHRAGRRCRGQRRGHGPVSCNPGRGRFATVAVPAGEGPGTSAVEVAGLWRGVPGRVRRA
jgi:hypothetical protein